MKNKALLIISAVVLLSIAITYLAINTSKLVPVTIRLKWINNAQFAGIYSAIENGYYKENKLSVTLFERDLKKGEITDEVAEGKVNFGITNSIDLIKAIDEGKKIKAIAAIYQESPSAIVSLKESNILSPQDLKGKKLGIRENTLTAKLFYSSILDNYKINRDEVEFIITGKNAIDDLKNKKVDTLSIYRTNEIYEIKKMELDYRIMRPEYYGFNYYDDVIITSDKMIEEHPEIVKKFITATIKGWKWTLMNENKAVEIIPKYAEKQTNSNKNSFIISNSKPLISWDGDSSIGEMDEKTWKNLITSFYDSRIIKNKLNPSEVYNNNFLNN